VLRLWGLVWDLYQHQTSDLASQSSNHEHYTSIHPGPSIIEKKYERKNVTAFYPYVHALLYTIYNVHANNYTLTIPHSTHHHDYGRQMPQYAPVLYAAKETQQHESPNAFLLCPRIRSSSIMYSTSQSILVADGLIEVPRIFSYASMQTSSENNFVCL